MKFIPLIINTLLIIVFCTFKTNAQQAITVSAGYNIGKNGSIIYSIGQPIYTTSINKNGSIAQGVLHVYPFPINTPRQITNIKVYPNPTIDYLNIDLENTPPIDLTSSLTFSVFDMTGKTLLTKESNSAKTILEITNFVPGTYVLRIVYDNQILKILKIIKK